MSSSSEHYRTTRRQARERAIELAYEAHLRQLEVTDLVATLMIEPEPFTLELLAAFDSTRDRAEELISATASGWSLDRMPVIDLLVMRLATAELLELDTPTGVALSEAVELVGLYSTEESSRFVNGVLAAIARQLSP